MTYTIQPLSQTVVRNVEKTGKTETEEKTVDGALADETIMEEHIQQLLAVCDSLNTLYERLNKLEYILQRKNIEISLTKKT